MAFGAHNRNEKKPINLLIQRRARTRNTRDRFELWTKVEAGGEAEMYEPDTVNCGSSTNAGGSETECLFSVPSP